MRDDAGEQLEKVNAMIDKAKTSLNIISKFSTPKTLQMELADIIPLGQFPEEADEKKPQ